MVFSVHGRSLTKEQNRSLSMQMPKILESKIPKLSLALVRISQERKISCKTELESCGCQKILKLNLASEQ